MCSKLLNTAKGTICYKVIFYQAKCYNQKNAFMVKWLCSTCNHGKALFYLHVAYVDFVE